MQDNLERRIRALERQVSRHPRSHVSQPIQFGTLRRKCSGIRPGDLENGSLKLYEDSGEKGIIFKVGGTLCRLDEKCQFFGNPSGVQATQLGDRKIAVYESGSECGIIFFVNGGRYKIAGTAI